MPIRALRMTGDCVPFAKLPHASKLFDDFLSGKLQKFYPRSVRFGEWCAEEAGKIHFDPGRRQAIANILKSQNRGWGASEKTLENIVDNRTQNQ